MNRKTVQRVLIGAAGVCALGLLLSLTAAWANRREPEPKAPPGEPAAASWSHWRGPEQNGVSREKDLPDKWDLETGENVIWKSPYGSRATPIVQNGRVYLVGRVGDGLQRQERVACLDAKDGKLLHEYRFNVFFTGIVSVRLGWSSLTGDPETGNIYCHGTQGTFICFDKDLKPLWQHSLTEEYGRVSGYGGRLAGPIVDGNLVIVSMNNSSWGELARGGSRFVAFDKKTGKVAWWASTGFPVKESFAASPVVAVINGERLLISAAGDAGVHAFKVRTGEKVWSYLYGQGMVNCSPVVDGNFVYIGQGEENAGQDTQGCFLCLDASKVEKGEPKLVWRVDGIKAKYSSPIFHEGRVYISDEVAKLYCLDAKTGNEIWTLRFGRNSKGSPVWADGKIYIPDVNAKFLILKPGEDKCQKLHTESIRSSSGEDIEINGGPAVLNGRIFIPTSEEMICIGKKDWKPAGAAIPAPPKQEPAAKDGKPAHVQVFPADVVLHPGESAEFTARLFDDKGRFLREAKAKWSLGPMLPPPPLPGVTPPPGPNPPDLKGEVTDDGKFTADKATPAQFGNVLAEVEGLKGRARIRVAPKLPYKQDFEKVPENRTPAGWINTQGKFAVRKVKDNNVLVKLSTNPSPLFARADAFIGVPSDTGYTIEVDVNAEQTGNDAPDMGITANRYTLQLAGNLQQLRLVSWDAEPRVDKSLAYAWKPGTWFRMKLTVEVAGGKAVVKGKVWDRTKPEPGKWDIEFQDPQPNTEGAPALYAYAPPGAEIFYDNLSVTPNK